MKKRRKKVKETEGSGLFEWHAEETANGFVFYNNGGMSQLRTKVNVSTDACKTVRWLLH